MRDRVKVCIKYATDTDAPRIEAERLADVLRREAAAKVVKQYPGEGKRGGRIYLVFPVDLVYAKSRKDE
jgi:hypothetical protein